VGALPCCIGRSLQLALRQFSPKKWRRTCSYSHSSLAGARPDPVMQCRTSYLFTFLMVPWSKWFRNQLAVSSHGQLLVVVCTHLDGRGEWERPMHRSEGRRMLSRSAASCNEGVITDRGEMLVDAFARSLGEEPKVRTSVCLDQSRTCRRAEIAGASQRGDQALRGCSVRRLSAQESAPRYTIRPVSRFKSILMEL